MIKHLTYYLNFQAQEVTVWSTGESPDRAQTKFGGNGYSVSLALGNDLLIRN